MSEILRALYRRRYAASQPKSSRSAIVGMIDVNSRRKASGIQHRARFGFYFEELVGIDIDYFDTTKQILRTILTEEDPMTTKKSGAKRSSRKY
ncbi:MAG: hypothetical protein JWQ42_193 [Edaphobacter sp.]|nr:hypothetical protein [Edaphobacter sp.]